MLALPHACAVGQACLLYLHLASRACAAYISRLMLALPTSRRHACSAYISHLLLLPATGHASNNVAGVLSGGGAVLRAEEMRLAECGRASLLNPETARSWGKCTCAVCGVCGGGVLATVFWAVGCKVFNMAEATRPTTCTRGSTPQTLNPNPKSQTLNPQPSTLNPQPSTLNPQS
jgi:hypothetical protein